MTVRCEGEGEDSCRGSEGEAGRGAGHGRRVGGRAAARQPGAAAGEAGGGPAPCRGRGCGGAGPRDGAGAQQGCGHRVEAVPGDAARDRQGDKPHED